MSKDINEAGVTQINDIEYFYEVILTNNSNKAIQLSQDAVKMLVITEDMDVFTKGYMIIDNSSNAMQRSFKNSRGEVVEYAYDFNLANDDYIFISITPKFFSKQEKNSIPPEVWTLEYTFTVYDIEELGGNEPDSKFKKIYFHDQDKQIMVENTSTYSNFNYIKSDLSPYQMDDEDRQLYTGDILRNIITESLPNAIISDEIWDEGANQVFYTSPTNETYLGDLLNVYNIHQSNVTQDFCILEKRRYTNEWVCEKFSDIVGKALDQNDKTKSGEYQMETFTIAESGETSTIPQARRVPNDFQLERNISFGDLSKIEHYSLFDLSKVDAMNNLVTTVGHAHDFNSGEFRIEHKDINDTQTFFTTNYSDKMRYSEVRGTGSFYVDDVRATNKRIIHSNTVLHNTENTLEYSTRNKVLKSAYVTNIGIEFSLVGYTHRRSGTFFSIQKEYEFQESEFENKLQGQWLCVKVDHVFSGSSYSNNIIGVRLNKS